MGKVRVILADDHSILRAGIRSILETIANVEVIGEASDGRQALQLIESLHPDVVFMDIGMKGMNGLDTTARVTKEHVGVRVVILSMHDSEEYVWRALRAGAAGYLLKDARPAEIELALQAIRRGETYLTPAVSRSVVADYIRRAGTQPMELLTPRQREILQLLAEGRSTKEIARVLSISVKTVETHRSQLMERLDIHDVPGLVRYAIREGLVQSTDR